MIETRFKQTELGVIPEDWLDGNLSDFAITSSGGTPSRGEKKFYNGDINWFTTGELKDCLLFNSNEKITLTALKSSAAKIFRKGTILIAMYGATIGKLGILQCDGATNQACCAINSQHINNM